MVFRRPAVALLILMPVMAAVGCGANTTSLDAKNTEPRAVMVTEPGGSSSGGYGSGGYGHDSSGGASDGHDGSSGGSGHDGSGSHGGSGGGNAHGISWPSDDK